MLKARGQAEHYARALPATEGRPPLLVVVDVGHSLELYSEFTRTGGAYVPFPDPQSHRLRLDRLNEPAVRERLRLAWTDPAALDPAKRSARVTREIAQSLGRLAASLEKSGHSAEAVATFLMRALFTMFAEDVELLPKDSFVNLLKSLHGHPEQFVPMIEELWGRMKTAGFSTVLREKVRHFNGGLFEQATALPLTADQFELLIEASRADWRDVEPAIFGTLLERALNPRERHRLGAHYTPRAYVERLVVPTVVEPLRAEWEAARAAALTLDRQGKTEEAAAEVQRFHRRLCEVRVLDPACGSGNFLYVTLEHLKRIEGEVLDGLHRLGHEQAALELAGFTVDPHQLLGLEVNPRAAAIAELVLWIGYLQWHFRTRGRVAPPEHIIKAFHNIECRDAVLAYTSEGCLHHVAERSAGILMTSPRAILPWQRGPAAWQIAQRAADIEQAIRATELPRFLSVRGAARLLGVSTQPVRDWIRLGQLARSGPRNRVERVELRRFVRWLADEAGEFHEDRAARFHPRGIRPRPFQKLARAKFDWPKGRKALGQMELAQLAGCHSSLVIRAIRSGVLRATQRSARRWEISRHAWTQAFPTDQAGNGR